MQTPQVQHVRSVCLFISHFWPVASGAENQAYAQGVELVRRGYAVHVLTRRVRGYAKEQQQDGLQIHRWLRPIRFGPLFGASFLTQGARALLRLRKSFDLVHTHQGLWEAAAAGLARRRLGKPVLVQPASGGVDGEMQTLAHTGGRTFLRQLILRNDHFAAISQEIAAELRATGVARERITETASGVDTERFSPGPSRIADCLPAGPRVLFVGRLAAQKNLAMLLRAWQEARETNEQTSAAVLLLAGDGPQRDQLRGLAAELGVEGSAHFLGAVDSVEQYLRAADLFVLPSRAEGSPNALLEAMSTGLPCIVSRIGGNLDLVDDGQSGIAVAADDVRGWAQAIGRLLGNPGEAKRLGDAARRWIVARRSLSTVVDQYEGIYGSLFRPRNERTAL